jgi:hypothetical protein
VAAMKWLRDRWRHADWSDRWLALPATVVGWVGVVLVWLDVRGGWWLAVPFLALIAVWIVYQFFWLRKARRQLDQIGRNLGKPT